LNNIEDLVAWRATLLNTLKNFDRNQGMHAIFVDKAMLESDSAFEKKYIFFKEWINSGIFFVNDIIDNNGKITQEFILHKLKNKSNWSLEKLFREY
jgi:hypothetical protein